MNHPLISSFRTEVLLAEHCTFGIGGPAKYLVTVESMPSLCAVIKACEEAQIRYMILGKGSNCLFDDRGFNGVVILNKLQFAEHNDAGLYTVGAGYSFSLLGVQTAREQMSGLEFASGIPGTVGGAVFMNAGANGSETCDALVSVDWVDKQGNVHRLLREELEFSYRYSSFQQMGGAIAAVTFQLEPSDTARSRQLEIVSYRLATQPYKSKSAGCMFRNPSCSYAGALIDRCGLKGFRVGGAMVSELHANFIVNEDQASAADVHELIRLIKTRVADTTGYQLESEVRFISYE